MVKRNEDRWGSKMRTIQAMERTMGSAARSKEVLEFKRAADVFVRKATSSAKAADEVMVRLGIQDRKGNLTKRYK